MSERASLPVVRLAIDTAFAYVNLSPGVRVLDAVDVTCDHQGLFDDRDRRLIRNAVERRLARTTRKRRRSA